MEDANGSGAKDGSVGRENDAAALLAFAGAAAPSSPIPKTTSTDLPETSQQMDSEKEELSENQQDPKRMDEIEAASPPIQHVHDSNVMDTCTDQPPEGAETAKKELLTNDSEVQKENTSGGGNGTDESATGAAMDVTAVDLGASTSAATEENGGIQQSQPMEISEENTKEDNKAADEGKKETSENIINLEMAQQDVEMKEPSATAPPASESEPKPPPALPEKEANKTNENKIIPPLQPAADEGVQVLENPPESLVKKRTKSFEETLERRKRRRRLRRMLKEAGEFPSFVALILASPDDGDVADEDEAAAAEEEAKDKTPEIIYIDVDEYLGLSKTKATTTPAAVPSAPLGRLRPNRTSSDPAVSAASSAASKAATPADEGYYEGRVPLASPEDETYLSTLQIMIRNNLEYFSATATDAAGSQSGRRYPIVQGKVGIRCIHCAKVALEHEAAMAAKLSNAPVAPDKPESAVATMSGTDEADPKPIDPSRIWPPGSVSYPLNIAGLYSVCSQKPQLHFEECPNMHTQIKAQFYRYVHEAGEARIKSREVPTPMYYAVAAKRIGLVNVPGGMRFGRDLTLEPLPLEAVLAQERQDSEEMKSQLPPVVPDQSTVVSAPQSVGSTPSDARTPADAASEQVLAEAVAEIDDPIRFPARAADKVYVSDYIFLCIRQMAICRAVPADLATRGKKTKSMRIGFAGFCCKHCQSVREAIDGPELARAHGASDYSCRSFSSAADNLASAISNSFALHLAKCTNVPSQVRAALAVYKRSHALHMSKLPYGSQRNCFHQIWERIRAADVPEDEMMNRINEFRATGAVPALPSSYSSRRPASNGKSSKTKPLGRSGSKFPVSGDPETEKVLKSALENWNPDSNNGLILPSDRELVSDYVLMTIRQLHVTLPTAADIAKGRRPIPGQSIIAGMCCLHCEKEDPSVVAPSARSFPSAPDNYASALNTSLYNHMQNCQFLPADIKRTLASLRRIHSQQIAHLKVGSQRRYFNLLYERLRKVPVPNIPTSAISKAKSPPVKSRSTSRGESRSAASSRSRVTRRSENGDDAILTSFGFFEAPVQSFFCARCRMVPLSFRARGSLSFARPTLEFMTEHSEACKEDGFDLWFVVESFKKLLKTEFDLSCMTDPLFKEVIQESLGGNGDLTSIFTSELVKVYQMSRHGGVTRAVESYVKAKSQGLWCMFPKTVDNAKVAQAFEKFAATKKGMSPQLADHSALVSFLLLISPSLSMPGQQPEEDDDGDSEEEDDDENVEGESEGGHGESDHVDEEEVEVDDDDDGDEDFKAPATIKVRQPKRGKELRRKKPPKEVPPVDDLDEVVSISEEGGDKGPGKVLRAEQKPEDGPAVDGNQPAEQEQFQVDIAAVAGDLSKLEEKQEVSGAATGEGSLQMEPEKQVDIGANESMHVELEDHSDADALMKEGIDEEQEHDLFSSDMSDGASFSHS